MFISIEEVLYQSAPVLGELLSNQVVVVLRPPSCVCLGESRTGYLLSR
jgi:hypothetical protein